MAYCHQSKDTASLQCSQATYNGQREYTELTAASTYRAAKNKDGQEKKKTKNSFHPIFGSNGSTPLWFPVFPIRGHSGVEFWSSKVNRLWFDLSAQKEAQRQM